MLTKLIRDRLNKTSVSDIVEFYHQLGLLIRANLPLSSSLRQLGKNVSKREFKTVLEKVAEKTASGYQLSDALLEYPRLFDPFHVKLLAAGESSNALPETLSAVAKFARFCQVLVTRIRDTIAYPFLTINMSIIVLFYLSIHVIPQFDTIFAELLGGALPTLTSFVLSCSRLINQFDVIFIAIYIPSFLFFLWLFLPGSFSQRVLLSIIHILPGSSRIVQSLDSARLCSILSIFMRNRMPLSDALEATSQFMERPAMVRALRRIATRIKDGQNFAAAAGDEKAIDKLLVLTFEHAPENVLSTELMNLSELYEHRVNMSAKSASAQWAIISFVLMTLTVGTVAIALFMPLISLISSLS